MGTLTIDRATTAWITGGSSGIGFAIARELALKGARVVLIGRSESRLDKARHALEAHAPGVRVFTRALDVSKESAVKQAVPAMLETAGGADLLVTAAGTARPGYFETLETEVLDESLAVNVYGTWHMVRALLPSLRERGGHIVTVSSLAGLLAPFGYTAYAASKYAVVGFSEALRGELARYGVGVTVLCPPDTDTPQLAEENRHKPPETAVLSRGTKVLSADAVARRCLRDARKGRFLSVPGPRARAIYAFKRLAPRLLYRIMDRAVARVSKK
ncbi:MAG: SDR family oxidoreductase [Spirochaetales bacterium]